MRKLDLTNPDDIVEFAKNYYLYKDIVSLPKNVFLEIEKSIQLYDEGLITNNERYNQTIDIVAEFIKDLDVKIKRK